MIYVWDDFNCRFLPVPAIDQKYTHKLTVWQHHVIRRYARHFVQDHVDITALCSAKEFIGQIIEGERLLTRRISAMQSIAHYLSMSQPDYEAAAGPPPPTARALEARQLPPARLTLDSDATVHLRNYSETYSDASREEKQGSVAVDDGQDSAATEEGWGASYDLPMEG